MGLRPDKKAYQQFGAQQTAQLQECEIKRALAVAAIVTHNTFVDTLPEQIEKPPFSLRGLIWGN